MACILTNIGFKQDQYKFVPISELKGDNMISYSSNLSWWNGGALLDALNTLEPPNLPFDNPLRLPIQNVYKISDISTVLTGRVELVIMRPGQQIIIAPSGIQTDIKSIEMYHQQLQKSNPGDQT